MATQNEFDAIVIGSGIGGLAFASIMAKLRKWRVLVLERHFKIGGFTHTFTRPGGWSWDVGLHYVGDMGKGMLGRRLFDYITDAGGEMESDARRVRRIFRIRPWRSRLRKEKRISAAR